MNTKVQPPGGYISLVKNKDSKASRFYLAYNITKIIFSDLQKEAWGKNFSGIFYIIPALKICGGNFGEVPQTAVSWSVFMEPKIS